MPRSRKNKVINVLMPPNVEVRLQAIMDAYRTNSMSHAVRIAIEQTAIQLEESKKIDAKLLLLQLKDNVGRDVTNAEEVG